MLPNPAGWGASGRGCGCHGAVDRSRRSEPRYQRPRAGNWILQIQSGALGRSSVHNHPAPQPPAPQPAAAPCPPYPPCLAPGPTGTGPAVVPPALEPLRGQDPGYGAGVGLGQWLWAWGLPRRDAGTGSRLQPQYSTTALGAEGPGRRPQQGDPRVGATGHVGWCVPTAARWVPACRQPSQPRSTQAAPCRQHPPCCPGPGPAAAPTSPGPRGPER